MKVEEVRLLKVRKLVQQAGGISAWAEKMQMDASQASQIAGINPTRAIGKKIARRIEDVYQLREGELDVPPPEHITLGSSPADVFETQLIALYRGLPFHAQDALVMIANKIWVCCYPGKPTPADPFAKKKVKAK